MIIFCGDSHTRPFDDTIFERSSETDKQDQIVWRAGATAAGFSRPNSYRKLGLAFKKACQTYKPKRACFNLGQVDAEVGYYYACMTHGPIDFETWVSARYESYIAHCKTFNLEFVIKGLNPSTLVSDFRVQSYVRRTTIKSFKTRPDFRAAYRPIMPLMTVAQHAYRNVTAQNILQDICRRENIPFFDIRDAVGSSEVEGLARHEFVAPGLDVHLIDSLAVREAYRKEVLSAFQFTRRAA